MEVTSVQISETHLVPGMFGDPGVHGVRSQMASRIIMGLLGSIYGVLRGQEIPTIVH